MIDDDIGFSNIKFDCQECGGKGYHINERVATPCTCWRLDNLKARMQKANIPLEYLEVGLKDLKEDVYGNIVDVDNNTDKYTRTSKNIHAFVKSYIFLLNKIVEGSGMGLFLCGGTGVGKTMLATVILKNALWYSVVTKKAHDDLTGYFITFKEYLDLRFKTKGDPIATELFEFIKRAHVLVLDEVGAEVKKKEGGVSDFYRSEVDDLLRYRNNNRLPTIITTNLSLTNFKGQYQQGGVGNVNRIWSIVEGSFYLIEMVSQRGDYRKIMRKDRNLINLKKIPDVTVTKTK